MTNDDRPWRINPLGDLTPVERAAFYQDLSEEDSDEHFSLFGKSDSRLFENPRLEIGIVTKNGKILPAEKYKATDVLHDTHINVYLERYFAHAMPGRLFELQLAVSSRHLFDGRSGPPDRISHTLVAKGVLDDYVSYMGEPVFQKLKVTNMLTLDIAVTFLTDRTTERLLQVLRGEDLRKGIELSSTYNPIFGAAATYVRGVVESLAEAKKNQPITDAHITLHSSPSPEKLSFPLVEGTYVLYQPSTQVENLMAKKPRFDEDEQKIVLENGDFNRNHMLFRIEKHS